MLIYSDRLLASIILNYSNYHFSVLLFYAGEALCDICR